MEKNMCHDVNIFCHLREEKIRQEVGMKEGIVIKYQLS